MSLAGLRGAIIVLATSALLAGSLPAVASPKTDAEALARYREAERIGKQHLKTFDTLDFDVYSNQKWDRLKESHAADILVHYPDGHTTRGIPDHIKELKGIFTFAPDTNIKTHPVRIESGDWTSVIGFLEGTFTKPMQLPGGKVIPPTGKPFKLTMSTVGHWKDGVMDEEYLFWDNASFMSQIGVGQ
ncbi:MAG: hypothetical protein JWQ89_2307 [Devosia sp.]|uniref:ester cyclase n=1 Tax=Devosia sp. TaxID=1871048 RepID=UPI002602DB7C|nr:ester cyclase [Devosia sp.]MDB5540580.1 hypothetical protein [Devosia sp.]